MTIRLGILQAKIYRNLYDSYLIQFYNMYLQHLSNETNAQTVNREKL